MKKERRERLISVLNRFSLIFHVFLACGVCFVIEWVSRHSFVEACQFLFERKLVFWYNTMIVYVSLLLVYLFKRRAVLRVLISVFWTFLGIINGCVLAKRVTPFGFTDLKMIGDLFTMQSNYFSMTEAIIVIVAVSLVIFGLVILWIKGPKFQGKLHPIYGTMMILAATMMIPHVTDAAVDNNILTSYFENLAQGYKDYGFVYSFSASVLDRGMSAPEGYSQEAIESVLNKKDAISEMTADSGAADEGATASLEAQDSVKTTSAEVQQEVNVSEEAQQEANVSAEAQQEANVSVEVQQEVSASAEAVQDVTEESNTETAEEKIPEDVDVAEQEYPNIICILLESFVDPGLINFLETSEDPIPNFHNLYENFTSGYLEVPVVGAGTANTEFEILTGMGMQFFGLGEYPYKTVLKETNCESVAADLKTLGYGAHAVHNNGGNFYSRKDVFSQMGFDTFTCKEMMDITEYTPIGTWPTDDILIGEVEKSLDYTPDQQDFVYTITVEGHGAYPEEQVLEDPEIVVTGPEEEGLRNQWEYYVNQIHQVDEFIGDLIDMLSKRDEKTFVVMFGDHLPTMGLTEEDMTTGSLFLTQYATWNNFGLEKEDKDMTAYQLLADMLDDLDIHTGTMFTYHQSRENYATEEEYQAGMELLQYDILYGEHYVYDGGDPYPATEIVMGTQEVRLESIREEGDYFYLTGENFTKWSKLYVNGEKVTTKYISSTELRVNKEEIPEGFSKLVVNQVGSSATVFRSSNEMKFMRKAEEKE